MQKDFPASVREIVLSGCQARCGLRPFYRRAEKQLAADAMEKMHITPLAKRCYRELSGGQQQRVLLDEPVTGLDPKAAAEMYALIDRLNREDGITIIMISHDISAAERYATHILLTGDAPFFGTQAAYQTKFAPKGGDAP